MLRNREQIEAILHRKAWARLMAAPFVQTGRQMLEKTWNDRSGPLAAVREWYQQPDNAALVRLLGELCEDEIFTYSGKNTAEFILLAQELNGANQFAPLIALAKQGPQANINDPAMRAKVILQALAESADKIRMPDCVIGFRLSRTKPADVSRRLKALDKGYAELVKAVPDIPQFLNLKKGKIHGADVHMLVLEGRNVPWDNLPLRQFEDQPGQFDKLFKRLKEAKVTLAVTVRGNYVLLGLGEGTAGLESVGEGLPDRLSARSELAPLAKASGRRLTTISYTSKAYQTAVTGGHYIEGLATYAGELLKDSSLSAEQKAKLEKGLKDLAADARRLASEPGAQLAYSFLTEDGSEGYAYDWTKYPTRASPQPLTLLRHVGGRPVAFALSREGGGGKSYGLLARAVRLGHQALEDLALPQLPDEARDLYRQFMMHARPLFGRLDKATGKMLLPSLDGQGGFVLDARLTSKQWHQAMPASETPLPLPEPAVVVGVRDRALFLKACREYRAVFDGLLEAVGKVSPTPIPEIKFPEPHVKKTKAGTLYSFPLPDALGLDAKLVPTCGLSDSVVAFTLSQEHAERLLTPTALKVNSGPLADAGRPLTGAGYFAWASLVDAAAPWVEYGLTKAGQGKEVLEQVQTVVAVLKVLRNYSSATYVEDGAIVTHGRTVIRDLEK
jgi:hypothetical protein